jgi:hypothetical protein
MKSTVIKTQRIETEINISSFSFQLKSHQFMKVRLTNGEWVALGGVSSDTEVTYDYGELKFDRKLNMTKNVR